MNNGDGKEQYFLTYSGISLPLRLVNPLSPDAVLNRNTYFSAEFDDSDRIAVCRKIVYGETEFEHRLPTTKTARLSGLKSRKRTRHA